MKVIALCDKDTASGLQLAGIETVYVPNNEKTAVQYWHEIEDNIESIGLIIVTEQIAEDIGKELNEFRLRNIIPIVVEIPDKHGRKTDHVDYVSHLIKKAVGMEIKR
jgi:V/A-type H+-transporting ATPase subunit F